MNSVFPKNIVLIGCGGGGSRMVASLVHFLMEAHVKNLTDICYKPPTVHLVDYDTVEAANLMRQAFYPNEIGELKVQALYQRFKNVLKINPIPEATNLTTLPKIFTEELMSEPFCVISKLDHAVSTGQLYLWLKQNAPSNSTYSWFFSGTSLVKSKFEGVFRSYVSSIDLPYVTAYMSGQVEGNPIIPAVIDQRFSDVMSRPLPTHIAHPDIVPAGSLQIHGRLANGEGCGMSDFDNVRQAALGNETSTLLTLRQMYAYYFEGVIIPEMFHRDYTTQSPFVYHLNEVLHPEEYPELQQLLTENEEITADVWN